MHTLNTTIRNEFIQGLDEKTRRDLDSVSLYFQSKVERTLSIQDIQSYPAGNFVHSGNIRESAKRLLPFFTRFFFRELATQLVEVFPKQMEDAISGAIRDVIASKGLSEGDTGSFDQEDIRLFVQGILWRLGNYAPKAGVVLMKKGIQEFFSSFQGKQFIHNGYTITIMDNTIFYIKTRELTQQELIRMSLERGITSSPQIRLT